MLGIGLVVSGLFDVIADIIFTHKMKKGPQEPEKVKKDAVEGVFEEAAETAVDAVNDLKEEFVEFKSDDAPTL